MKDELEKKFLCPKNKYFSMEYALKNIDFMSDFDDNTASWFIHQIRAYSKLIAEEGEAFKGNTDINLYINSRGGIVTSLLAMIDAMSLVPNDFCTIAIGQCASCGAVLLSCGTKGKRFITENARVLIHQVSAGMWGTNSEIQVSAKEAERVNNLLLGILAKNCGKTVAEIEQLTLGGDLILDAKQAVEFGIVDAILDQNMIEKLNNGEDIYVMPEKQENIEQPETNKCKPKEKSGEQNITNEFKANDNYSTTSLNLEMKGITEDENYYYITGLASTPDLDRVKDIVKPDALLDSVDRIGYPAFMHQHNLKEMPLGVCTSVTQENGDTIVSLKMPKDDYTSKIKARAEMGAYQGLSIGFIVKDSERNRANGHRVIKSLDWYEVSLVTVPANPNAKLISVKSNNSGSEKMQENIECDIMQDIKTVRDVENFLVSIGCSKKEAGYMISVAKQSSKGDPNDDENSKGEPSNKQEQHEDIEKNQEIEALKDLRDFLSKK